MVPNMKVNGKIIRHVAKGFFTIAMEIYVLTFNNFLDNGMWKDDKANGYGIYTHLNGSRYEGEWLDDL